MSAAAHTGRRDRDRADVLRLVPRDTAGLVAPHDDDAEAAVLSACMVEPGTTETLVADLRLTPDDFYAPSRRRYFAACVALASSGSKVDPVTVAAWLRSAGDWHGLDDVHGLNAVATETPDTRNATEHGRIVRDKARLRAAIATAQEAAARLYAPGPDVQAQLSAVAQTFAKIAEAPDANAMQSLRSIVELKFEELLSPKPETDRGVTTGLADLDAACGRVEGGWLWLLAARPGIGKTAFAVNNVAAHVAHTLGGVAIFSLEMNKRQLVDRWIAAESGVPLPVVRAGNIHVRADYADRVTKACSRLVQLPVEIDDTPKLGAVELRSRAMQAAERFAAAGTSLRLIVVDYAQLMAEPIGARSREEAVAENARQLKAMAKMFDVPVLALVQMNRDADKRTGRSGRPRLSDLRESGEFENTADVIMFLTRDREEPTGPATVVVGKFRHGAECDVEVMWRGPQTRFDNAAAGTNPPPTSWNERGET